MSEAISEQEVGAHKQRLHPEAVAAAVQWRYAGIFANGQAAASYLNLTPAQHAGEMSATVFDDGRVALFIYF